jgi:hypothetical protein
LFVDSYHGSDDIFVNDLARSLSKWHELGRSAIIVHNPTEHIQRFLEAKGQVHTTESGSALGEWRDDVQRIVVEANRRIVSQLTEFGVSAVPVSGADRSTITVDSLEGSVNVGVAWLSKLAIPGVVPVLAPIGRMGGSVVSVRAGEVLNSFAQQMDCNVVVFPRRGRFSSSSGFEIDLEGLNGPGVFYDFDEIRRISKSIRLFMTHPKGLKTAKMDGKWVPLSDFV